MIYDDAIIHPRLLEGPRPPIIERRGIGEYGDFEIESELRLEQRDWSGQKSGVFYDTHHIFSQTFFPWYRRDEWNLVECRQSQHVLFHQVFGVSVPVQAVRFVRLFRSFVPGDSVGEVLSKLRSEFWPKDKWLEKTRINGDGRLYWQTLLTRKPRGRLYLAILGDRTPWQTARLIERYFALVGDAAKTEDQTLAFLGETFWPTVRVGERGLISEDCLKSSLSNPSYSPVNPRATRRFSVARR